VPVAGRFIVDLLVPELRLVIEVDGRYHARRRNADARRDRALARAGYRVLRLEAEQVMGDLPAAVARIRTELERLRGPTER
jgi:very-short-patch-repair endonuclease